jgi:hypothetical protein
LFVGLLISKTHDDFTLYHFQYLKELSDNALKLGLANIDVRYGYSSLFSYIQGIFILPYYGLKFFHVPVYLIYTSLINYLFFKSFEVKNNKKFLIIFLEIFLIIKFKRLSEFGYDYFVQFLLIYLFVEFYTLARKTKENIFANLVIYLSAIAFKIISIFFLPVILFFLYVEKKYFIECLKKKLYFLSLLFIFFIILFDSFLKTGCLHYAFPTGFPMDVLEIMKREPKICNYIDIPLQHISDSILKSMRRGTTREKTTQLLKDFRAAVPGMAIRTTLIVGYPGESLEDFKILKDFVQEMKFDRMGCFAYSHEENTHAYLLDDDVPSEVKQARAEEIMELQSQISWDLNQEKVGKTFKCIIDRKEGAHFVGRTEFDSPDVDNEVLIDASKHYVKTGEFVMIKIIEATEFDLYGEPV